MRPRSEHLPIEREKGFSLVELLIALVFTLVLMAGMATVFQASLGTFVTTGEKLSSSRRNRMSVDMIYDDLNAAGMLLTSLADYSGSSTNPINLNAGNPPFRITPNVAYAGTDVIAPNNLTDQLDLYFDEALPFEGTVSVPVQGVMEYLPGETSYTAGATRTLAVRDSTQAAQLASENALSPVTLLYRANMNQPQVPMTLTTSGSQVNVTMTTSLTSADATSEVRIPQGTGVLFVKPGRYVRYSIQPRNLDPDPANAGTQVPCLIRDETVYSAVSGSPNPFAAPVSSVIVAENVVGFQVMVSPDGGQTWINNPYDAAQRDGDPPTAGTPGLPHTTFTTWAEVRDLLGNHAAITSRPAPNTVEDGRFWFKDIPVTIRVDITTRTARPRSEYLQNQPHTIVNSTGPAPYKIQTQSIVLVPRHFGLSYGPGLI